MADQKSFESYLTDDNLIFIELPSGVTERMKIEVGDWDCYVMYVNEYSGFSKK